MQVITKQHIGSSNMTSDIDRIISGEYAFTKFERQPIIWW